MDNFNKALKFINDHKSALKPEVIVASLIEMGISRDEIIVSFIGQHKRNWSKDISDVEYLNLKNGEEKVQVKINQDGIFDSLPEVLFHKIQNENIDSGEEMANESKNLRAEEKEARSFFMPMENEIFSQNIKLANNETSILKNIHSDLLHGLIPDFWKIDSSISKEFANKIISVLPLAYKIAGDFDLTAQCLSYILNEKVELETNTTNNINSEEKYSDMNSSGSNSGILGYSALGIDTVCGQSENDFSYQLDVKIGPLENISAHDCLESGPIYKVLNCFYDYFIPVELTVNTQFRMDSESNYLLLSEDGDFHQSYLGMNTEI